MPLSQEVMSERGRQINREVIRCFNAVAAKLGIDQEVEGKRFHEFLQSHEDDLGESPSQPSYEEVETIRSKVLALIKQKGSDFHPLNVFGFLLSMNVGCLLRSEQTDKDLETFKSRFNAAMDLFIDVEYEDPGFMDYLTSTFNALMGVIISIATLGIAYVVDSEWTCSFFAMPKPNEVLTDKFEGKFREDLNDAFEKNIEELAQGHELPTASV